MVYYSGSSQGVYAAKPGYSLSKLNYIPFLSQSRPPGCCGRGCCWWGKMVKEMK
ncbi:hypothetical protein HYX14_03345 [Candidatus Woesearchaeota archaeon]|nr:hypothetical protein [Candidatus Woesearchaeota archaeon]